VASHWQRENFDTHTHTVLEGEHQLHITLALVESTVLQSIFALVLCNVMCHLEDKYEGSAPGVTRILCRYGQLGSTPWEAEPGQCQNGASSHLKSCQVKRFLLTLRRAPLETNDSWLSYTWCCQAQYGPFVRPANWHPTRHNGRRSAAFNHQFESPTMHAQMMACSCWHCYPQRPPQPLLRSPAVLWFCRRHSNRQDDTASWLKHNLTEHRDLSKLTSQGVQQLHQRVRDSK